MRIWLLLFLPCFAWLFGCSESTPSVERQAEDLAQWVNPMIGTTRMGHTYPGATVPYGMVPVLSTGLLPRSTGVRLV